MTERQSVLVWGYYDFGNLGDELVLQQIYTGLAQRGVRRITVNADLAQIHAITPDPRLESRSAPVAAISGRRIHDLIAFLRSVWFATKGNDILLLGGGTLIHSRKGFRASLWLTISLLICARLRRMRCVGFSLGVGEIEGLIGRLQTTLVAELLHFIGARDRHSFESLHGSKRPKSRCLTGDIVWCWNHEEVHNLQARPVRDMHQRLLISLSPPSMRSHNHDVAQSLNQMVADAVENDLKVCLLPMQELERDSDFSDTEFLATLTKDFPSLSFLKQVEVLDKPRDIDEIGRVVASSSGIVAGRFHSLVVAAQVGTPVVGFSMESKVRDLCNELGLHTIDPALNSRRNGNVIELLGIPTPERHGYFAQLAEVNWMLFDRGRITP